MPLQIRGKYQLKPQDILKRGVKQSVVWMTPLHNEWVENKTWALWYIMGGSYLWDTEHCAIKVHYFLVWKYSCTHLRPRAYFNRKKVFKNSGKFFNDKVSAFLVTYLKLCILKVYIYIILYIYGGVKYIYNIMHIWWRA